MTLIEDISHILIYYGSGQSGSRSSSLGVVNDFILSQYSRREIRIEGVQYSSRVLRIAGPSTIDVYKFLPSG